MTQAELAGGTIDARQASPAKGQLIRDFTLTSTLGQEISLSDYRGRSNLVLVFVGGGVGSPDLKILAEIGADHARLQDEQTQVLAIMQCTQETAARIEQKANLPFPLLVDEDGRIHRSAGAADQSVTRHQQSILPTASAKSSLCTGWQKDRPCQASKRLWNG